MKILVIFSGLIRGTPQDSVDNMKYLLPEADIKCVTWKRDRDFELPIEIDKEYDEPKMNYYPMFEKRGIQKSINYLKEFREEHGWPPKLHHIEEIKKLRGALTFVFKHRNRWKNRSKQQLIHALACKDFMDGYDIIIRARYDAKYVGDRDFFRMCVDKVWDTGIPLGFGAIAGYEDQESPAYDPNMHALADFFIIHRADYFDPDRVIRLFNEKKLHGAEAGWAQSMSTLENPPDLEGPWGECYQVPEREFSELYGGLYREGNEHIMIEIEGKLV